MSLNTIRAILIINAKKASKKGMGKTKGWTDEARAKAALTRKAKKKIKSEKVFDRSSLLLSDEASKAAGKSKGASGPTSASELQSHFDKSSGLKGVKFSSSGGGSSKSAYGGAELSKAAENHAKKAGFREVKGPTLSSKATHRWFLDSHGNKMTIMSPNEGQQGKHSVSFTESNKYYAMQVKKAKVARGQK